MQAKRSRCLNAENLSCHRVSNLTNRLPDFKSLVSAPGEISIGHNGDEIEGQAPPAPSLEPKYPTKLVLCSRRGWSWFCCHNSQ